MVTPVKPAARCYQDYLQEKQDVSGPDPQAREKRQCLKDNCLCDTTEGG